MNKSVNVLLNSRNAIPYTITAGNNVNSFSTINLNNLSYYVNLRNILKQDKKYHMHWTYIGGENVLSSTTTNNSVVLVSLDFNTNSVVSTSGGALHSQLIGFLKPIVLVGSSGTCYLQAEDNTNLPIYLENAPGNAIINVRISDQLGNPYIDDTSFSGTGNFSGGVMTITNVTAGRITAGMYLFITSSIGFIVTSLGTGTGLNGTYNVTYSGTFTGVGVGTNGTAFIGGNPNSHYLLSLKFTEADD